MVLEVNVSPLALDLDNTHLLHLLPYSLAILLTYFILIICLRPSPAWEDDKICCQRSIMIGNAWLYVLFILLPLLFRFIIIARQGHANKTCTHRHRSNH